MAQEKHGFLHTLDKSAVITVIGIILLFSASIAIILVAPSYVDPAWTNPSSTYQVQMYEISDPNLYIGSTVTGSTELQFVYHLQLGKTLLAFREAEAVRIVAPPELEKYVTRLGDKELKLTPRLFMLRPLSESKGEGYDRQAQVDKIRKESQEAWERANPDWKEKGLVKPIIEILEIYPHSTDEAFAVAPVDGMIENWVSSHFIIVDEEPQVPYDTSQGTIYIGNPREYRVSHFVFGKTEGWRYDPEGERIQTLQDLRKHPLTFYSRAELIREGEHLFAVEGCWYCHTDQTRTLVQDVVLNGSAAYPAPPSSPNEYIYEEITFPGTRRIGPDLSRTGVKRPGRDWHKGHFWAPKTASAGSIMPAFKHFFDSDPAGMFRSEMGIPNHQFEAVYQYLMTKGTRITPPTEAWWLGKDPVNTKAIIEGRKMMFAGEPQRNAE